MLVLINPFARERLLPFPDWEHKPTHGTMVLRIIRRSRRLPHNCIVTGTDVNGCEDNDTVQVIVNTLPLVDAGPDQVICIGENTILAGNGAVSYTWNNGVTDNTVFNPATTQSYIVTGTDANGCEDNDTVQVTVNALPVIDLGEDTVTCANYGPVVLNAGAGFAAYLWNNNATTATLSATATGTYFVAVTDQNGCQNSDAIVVTVDPCLGLNEQAIDLALFPNPTTGLLTIESSSAAPMQVELMNTAGQILLTSLETTIDLSTVAAGTYLLRVQQGNETHVFRIEKTN